MNKASVYRIQLMKVGKVPIEIGKVTSVEDAQQVCRSYLLHEYGGCFPDREVFGAVWLNTKNLISGLEIVSIGSLNATIAHPRELFKSGIIHNASSLIVFHNHPSGDTTPSTEDINVTKRLQEAGDILGIELLDHLILGETNWYSMKQAGRF
ncbi:JAB domain-containing protein [Paenibacillus gallinarum]|nr:JAB domain-containing protein [Paenibacillus gallinarum]